MHLKFKRMDIVRILQNNYVMIFFKNSKHRDVFDYDDGNPRHLFDSPHSWNAGWTVFVHYGWIGLRHPGHLHLRLHWRKHLHLRKLIFKFYSFK